MPKNSEREGQSRILVYAPHLKKLDTAAGTERTVNKDNVWKPTSEGKIDDYFVNKRSNLIKGAGRFGTNGNCLFKPKEKTQNVSWSVSFLTNFWCSNKIPITGQRNMCTYITTWKKCE